MSDADYDRALQYERRISTLEARIAELEGPMSELACAECVHVWCIQRRAVVTLEARIAELTAERDYWRKAAGTQMCGPNCAHCLYQDERVRAAAARADRDEAAGLLRDCVDGWRKGKDTVTPMAAAINYLARHPAQPETP